MPAYFWSGAGYSRRGGRDLNEDNYYLDGTYLPEGGEDTAPRTLGLRARGLLAVFDGMGGEEAGEYASFTAAREDVMAAMGSESLLPACSIWITRLTPPRLASSTSCGGI